MNRRTKLKLEFVFLDSDGVSAVVDVNKAILCSQPHCGLLHVWVPAPRHDGGQRLASTLTRVLRVLAAVVLRTAAVVLRTTIAVVMCAATGYSSCWDSNTRGIASFFIIIITGVTGESGKSCLSGNMPLMFCFHIDNRLIHH